MDIVTQLLDVMTQHPIILVPLFLLIAYGQWSIYQNTR